MGDKQLLIDASLKSGAGPNSQTTSKLSLWAMTTPSVCQKMTKNGFSLVLIAIALSLGSCSAPPPQTTDGDAVTQGIPSAVTLEATTASDHSAAPKFSNPEEAITNVSDTLQPLPATSPDSPIDAGNKPVEKPAAQPAATTSAEQPTTNTAKPSPASPSSQQAETLARIPADKPPATPTSITIDETICGAGGQEAYFETKIQEIYICKNEADALTYIATPKKQGNSQFLPAQKVKQGDVVGYIALEQAKTYIITPGGFQLQDGGTIQRSEKVIRRQLAYP